MAMLVGVTTFIGGLFFITRNKKGIVREYIISFFKVIIGGESFYYEAKDEEEVEEKYEDR